MKKILCTTMIFICYNALQAQPGSLDPTFDTDGIVTTSVGTDSDFARAIAIQNDGKIVVAGYTGNNPNFDFAVARYNTDGSLDLTFDSDGKTTTAIGTQEDNGRSVAIQSDGKIIVAGWTFTGTYMDFAMVRYNTDGSLDNTFDSDGKVVTPVGFNNDYCEDIAIQSDGRIVLFGNANGKFTAVRYNTNGSLDNTFDSDGIAYIDFGIGNEWCYSGAIQADGKMVLSGYSNTGSSDDFAVARFNSDGSADNTFDGDGMVTTDFFGNQEIGFSVCMQHDGKIVVGGVASAGSSLDIAGARYNTDGSLDNTFDSDGKVTTDLGGTNQEARTIAMATDQRIVMAGYHLTASFNFELLVVRYNTDGSLDNTFDSDGSVTTAAIDDIAYGVAVQTDNKIVAAGMVSGFYYEFAVARYDGGPIGIYENEELNICAIFPNPVNNQLNFVSENVLTGASIKITNSTGQTIFTKSNLNGNNFMIDVSGFVNGIYFLEVNDNQNISKAKFIKK